MTNKTVNMNYGERLRCVRKIAGFTQAELSEYLGFSSPTVVQRYEKEMREPDRETLVKIVGLAQVEVYWVLTGLGWTYRPSNSSMAEEFLARNLSTTKRLIVITYDDGKYGLANGFVLEGKRGIVTVEGGATRSGYRGGSGGPNAYRSSLEAINKRDIPVVRVEVTKDTTPDWDHIDLTEFVARHKAARLDIDEELRLMQFDLYPERKTVRTRVSNMKACAALHVHQDLKLAEIVEMLEHEMPDMKNHILQLLRGVRKSK